jgi:hypothetical protein
MTIHGTYPLVISQFAIENGYLYLIYLLKKTDFSKVMSVYQRVNKYTGISKYWDILGYPNVISYNTCSSFSRYPSAPVIIGL